MSNANCLSCGYPLCDALKLGPQPPSNRFLLSQGESCPVHELTFCFCKNCGLAQLRDPMSTQMVSCLHEWLIYNEPERHLDTVVSHMSSFLTAGSSVLGISYKDATLLKRIERVNGSQQKVISPVSLGLAEFERGIDKIQGKVTSQFAKGYAAEHGLADVLIARHILEHSHNPRAFLDACSHLVKEGGLLLFEVPGNESIFRDGEHCFLWEEHISYFTKSSLKYFFDYSGFQLLMIKQYSFSMENSLVAILRNVKKSSSCPEVADMSFDLIDNFVKKFEEKRNYLHVALGALREDGKNIALLGAGHLAVKFINFYGLEKYISLVIDDFPEKKGKYLPVSMLQISGSEVLTRTAPSDLIDVCLLSLNSESEEKVRVAKKFYTDAGGSFLSIFTNNSCSIFSSTR